MGDIGFILQNAILYTAGNEGLEKFTRAGYRVNKIVHSDGSLDLPGLMNMLLDTFPEEQASAIADNVLAKYVDMGDDDVQSIVDNAKTYNREETPEEKAEEKYENNLAQYLETEASDVRDLINEARRIRIAMGKSPPPRIVIPEETIQNAIIDAEPHQPKISLVSQLPHLTTGSEMSEDKLESEIRGFVENRNAHSSIDIMDFTRYLKDKGYLFQENTVLEKIYTRLEERKNRERDRLLADIQGFLSHNPWPSENEVSAYIEQKRSEGILSEGPEVKRMILVEMIRKH